jgi:hypothetical protein
LRNPYAAPGSAVTQCDGGATYDPVIWSAKGRIGRCRYLAYSMHLHLLLLVLAITLFWAIGTTKVDGPILATVLVLAALGMARR